MKKILITSTGFTGAVQVLYGEPGMGAEAFPPLLNVDLSGAVLTDEAKVWLLQRVPVRYGDTYQQDWRSMKLRFVEEDYEPDLERDFWIPYDKKVNLKRCQQSWANLTKHDRVLAVAKLGAYLRYLSQHQWRTKADPHMYLKNRYWDTDWDNVTN